MDEREQSNSRNLTKGAVSAVPLVFLHGLLNCMDILDEADVFSAKTCQQLAGVECIRYDARGHGGSQGSSDPDAYKWENLSQDCLTLTSLLGVDKFVCGGEKAQ